MEVKEIMTQDPSGAHLVEYARQTADTLVKNNLTRSQIRNIFTEVRRIEDLWEAKINEDDREKSREGVQRRQEALRRLNMLKPKLDYQTARTPAMKVLRDVLTQAIEQVEAAPEEERDQRFQRFADLFEAILAYHRALGGRN